MKTKVINLILFVVTLKGLLIGIYHLYLPTHWQWEKGLTQTPEILKWALLTLNDMWSMLIILSHAAMILCFKNGSEKLRCQIGLFLALYWFAHAIIITLNPIPMPEQMKSLLFVLMLIPYIQSMVFLLASWHIRSTLR